MQIGKKQQNKSWYLKLGKCRQQNYWAISQLKSAVLFVWLFSNGGGMIFTRCLAALTTTRSQNDIIRK